jgi:hypothetical protein
MQQTVTEIENLERENALLRYQIAQLATIPRIEARAKQLGLGPMHRKTTYLAVPENPWGREALPTSTITESESDDVRLAIGEPVLPGLQEIWQEVVMQFEAWIGQR